MRDVWSTAESFGVDTLAIEERILIQMLYTDAFVGNAAAIFQNYVKKGGRSIGRAGIFSPVLS